MWNVFLCDKHWTNILYLSKCFLTSPELQTLQHQWCYIGDQAGHWLWSNTCLWCVPKEVKVGQIGWLRGPQNGSTSTDPHYFLIKKFSDKSWGMWWCPILLEDASIRYMRYSIVLSHAKAHSSCQCFSWKKNGPITFALVNLHHMFNFGLSHSRSLYHENSEIPKQLCQLTFPKMWKLASSLKHHLLRQSLLSI
jgi:hypothetical protein